MKLAIHLHPVPRFTSSDHFSLAYAGMGNTEVTINIRHMLVTHIFTVYCSMRSAEVISSSGKLPTRSNKIPTLNNMISKTE
jgi:hypothetical protein